MLTLIENGEIYAPEPLGKNSILLGAGKIFKIGAINCKAIESLSIELDVLILPKETLKIKDVIAGSRRLMKNGRLNFKEKFLEKSNREINLKGNKSEK